MEDLFKTIASYQYSSEAEIVRGRLQADGIEVFLQDAVTIDTDPLVSNAIGGVKIRVRSVDALKAKHILNSIKHYALDDQGEFLSCPNCHSEEVNLYSTITDLKSFFSFLLGVVTGTLPMSTRYQYRCEQCDHEFSTKSQ